MRAGSLYRRITVQRVTYVDDGYGSSEQWQDAFSTWAQMIQESGREFIAAAAVQATRRVVFRLRWRPGISVLDRVIYRGLPHNIEDVKELGRADGLELHTIASATEAAS